MPTPAVSLRLRKFRRRFGITAPRVVVRSHWPWQWRLGFLLLPIVALALIVGAVLRSQELGVLGGELERMQHELAAQAAELAALRGVAGTGQNQGVIERAAQGSLVQRIAALERENASLREDIRFFERLVPGTAGQEQLRIENFRLVSEGGGRYRYHLLLAFQPDKQQPELRASMRFRLTFAQDGRQRQVILPDASSRPGDFSLEVKQFARREGVLSLPQAAVLGGAEVSIMQGGVVKARRAIQL